jgi:hypothetical protein
VVAAVTLRCHKTPNFNAAVMAVLAPLIQLQLKTSPATSLTNRLAKTFAVARSTWEQQPGPYAKGES